MLHQSRKTKSLRNQGGAAVWDRDRAGPAGDSERSGEGAVEPRAGLGIGR